MLRSRIIPCLLIQNNGLVKTINFGSPKYVGDPINAVKIFNEKEVDELIVLDIDKTIKKESPNFELIQKLANECRMPLCYGGGINNVEDAVKIISMGVEKIALSSAAIKEPELCNDIGSIIGFQSVVIILDLKKPFLSNDYKVYTENGTKKCSKSLIELLEIFDNIPVGEIVINNIDRDGTMKGFDEHLISLVRSKIKVPSTFLGGASSLDNIKQIINKNKIIGVAAGSLFVFKGKYRAVLINYPNREERKHLY
tara:strand:+ start:633 stop:1394 length:762 start_codon:yes stop_codon:yes gene_type:complete